MEPSRGPFGPGAELCPRGLLGGRASCIVIAESPTKPRHALFLCLVEDTESERGTWVLTPHQALPTVQWSL